VEGFETGQTTLVTKAARTGTKTRGGKRVRLQADKELALSQQSSGRMANVSAIHAIYNIVCVLLYSVTPTHRVLHRPLVLVMPSVIMYYYFM
jgi:hypothetical protein